MRLAVFAALAVPTFSASVAMACSSGGGDGAACPPNEVCSDATPDAAGPSDARVEATPPQTDGGVTPDGEFADGDAPLPLRAVVPGPLAVDEDHELRVTLRAEGGVGSARIFVAGLPPGAEFDEPSGVLRFVPDFTQGGATWHVVVTVDDGAARAEAAFDVTALDTIRPPTPVITATSPQSGYARLTVTQTTDAFLDSPGFAGRTFTAVVVVPTGASATAKLPVRVGLHGFDGAPSTDGWSGEFRIFPGDPDDTSWWGYSDQLPAGPPNKGAVPEYTARRVLHLLAWLKATQPGADAERVYLDGVSMGGAGAMTIGLLHARHFCHVRAGYGQAIPKNHRPTRVAQLAPLWGDPSLDLDDGHGMGAWTRMDLTRVLREVDGARDQFLTLHHAKDDDTIHFGAVVLPSPLTGTTFYEALESQHVGHFAAWDEGGHVVDDPVLGAEWWTKGWDPVFDTTSLLRLHLAFPAFSRSSADEDPGDGKGNGKQPWSPSSGYAGKVGVPGDTGWNGAIAGAYNRFLRWDSTKSSDTTDRFEVPLRVLDGAGASPPRAGYPTTGDRLGVALPVVVDVTPRRVQAFRLRPGERVAWSFGAKAGVASADAMGAVTIPRLELSTAWTTLVLTRAK